MAIASDQERLVVALEARIRDFERNMQRASRTAGKQFGNIEKRAEQSANRVASTFKHFGKGIVAGIAAGGIAGIVSQISQVAKGIAEIGDKAKMAGLSNEAFQELGYVAKANRIEVDALTDGMKELLLRADEFVVTGKGSAAESFQRLGYSAQDLRQKLADPSALFTEIIGKLGQLDKAAQIRIADELFGGSGGEKFVQLISQGEAGIRATIQEARNLGAVLSDEVIERAAELDRQFNAVATTVGTALKGAIVGAAAELTKFLDQFRAFEQQATTTLKDRFGELQTRYGQLVKQRGTLEDQALGLIGKDAATEIEAVKAEMDQIAAQLTERAKPMLREKLVAANTAATPYTPPPSPSTGGSSAGGRSAAASGADREADAVRRLIAELEEELRLVGASDQEKRAAAILRQAGAAATDHERQKLVELNEAIYQSEQGIQRAADTSAFFRDTAGDAFMSLIPAINTGNAALDQFINTLIQAVAQAALLGGGPLAGLFGGGVLGFAGGGSVAVPGFAAGGRVSGPGTGTSDSILARVSDGEFIVRAGQARKHQALLEAVNDNRLPAFARGGLIGQDGTSVIAPGGNVVSINAPVTVNAQGGSPEENQDLANRMSKAVESTLRGIVSAELRNSARPGNFANSRAR